MCFHKVIPYITETIIVKFWKTKTLRFAWRKLLKHLLDSNTSQVLLILKKFQAFSQMH